MVHREVFPGVTGVNSVSVFVGSHTGTSPEPEIQSVYFEILRRCNTTRDEETLAKHTHSEKVQTHTKCELFTYTQTHTDGPNTPDLRLSHWP